MTRSAVEFTTPLLAGTEESWRRFLQELDGSRREEYADLRRRLGIIRQQVWLLRRRRRELSVLRLECEEPSTVAARLAASTEPFDVWLKARLVEFHGCDFTDPSPGWSPELVFGDQDEPPPSPSSPGGLP